MGNGPSHHEKFWKLKRAAQLREEYAVFLREEGKEPTPHNAHIFALKKLAGSNQYLELTEREIIMELAGKLPHMYD